MKAALKAKYDVDKNGGAAATIAFKAGDVKLRTSITDATVVNGPCLTGLALAVEKPGSFIVDYNVPKKVFRNCSLIFQVHVCLVDENSNRTNKIVNLYT